MMRCGRVRSWAAIGAVGMGLVMATLTLAQPQPPPGDPPRGGGAGGPGGGGPGRMAPPGEGLPPPGGPGGMGGGGGGMFPREGGPERLSEEEQNRFRVFANTHMPNISFAIEEVRLPRQRLWLTGTALFHYRRYERGRRDFPQMEEQLLQDVRNIDELVRLAREYPTSPPERQAALRAEMRERMVSVSTSMLEERRRRIERLREQLDREEAALDRDQAQIEQSIDQRLEEFLRLGPGGGLRGGPDGGGRPGGGPPPPEGGPRP